jgi:hypothetical protein
MSRDNNTDILAAVRHMKVGDEVRCERAMLCDDRVRLRLDGVWFDLKPPNNGSDYIAPGAGSLGLENAAAQRDPLLVERQSTHGDFVLNATISQKIKEAIAWGDVKGMRPVHREALDMIALKISRICSGQADYKDHWDDLTGYAKLGSEAAKP